MSLRKYRLSVGVENVHSVIPGMQMEKLYGRVRRSCLAPMKAMWRFAGSTTKKENYGKEAGAENETSTMRNCKIMEKE